MTASSPFNATTKLCMIVGSPVSHSLSPVMHNTAYRALGIEDKYVYLASEVSDYMVGHNLVIEGGQSLW